MIRFTSSGNTRRTEQFLDRMIQGDFYKRLEQYAIEGVNALKANTPRDSGLTADSWSYEIDTSNGKTSIWWKNSNIINGFSVVIGLQYGHGTGSGGYVQGRDFINPVLKPIFDKIADSVWEEVRKS